MYFSVKDVAKMLNCSDETIRIKIRTGKLIAKKYNNKFKIFENDIYNMVRENLSDENLSNEEVKEFIKSTSVN